LIKHTNQTANHTLTYRKRFGKHGRDWFPLPPLLATPTHKKTQAHHMLIIMQAWITIAVSQKWHGSGLLCLTVHAVWL